MHCRTVIALSLAIAFLIGGWSAQASAADAVDLSGKWHGSWVSCKSGHHGKLNARFCQISETCYQVRFTGTFFGAVPFAFSVKLSASPQADGTVVLSGDPRLPFFGTFHFIALATDREFTASYTSRNDEGRFLLSR